MNTPVVLLTVATALLLCISPANSTKIENYEASTVLRGFHHVAEPQDVAVAHVKSQFLDATTVSTDIRFVDKLQSDVDAFISDVKSWLVGVAGESPQSEVVVTSAFALETKGDFDVDAPCGDLTAYRTFPVIKKFLDNPQYATLDNAAANSIMWHPSKTCVTRTNSIEVDGGSHVEFVATCGDKLLLNVSSASGGVTKTVFFKKVETTGAFVGVDFSDGDIRAVGATGRLISKLKLRQIPDKVNQVLKIWSDTVRSCAAQNQLEITGVVGGGWTQKYSRYGGLVGAFDTYVLAYARSFKITYQGIPTEAPLTAPPTTQPPAIQALTTQPPVTQAPTTAPPVTKVAVSTTPPVTEAPKAGASVTEPPKTVAPAIVAPTEEPKTVAPVTVAPTEAPATMTLATVAPIEAPSEVPTEAPTEAPGTNEPDTETPATEDSAAEEPITKAPVTDEPVLEAPVTEAPETSEFETPETMEPETETPTDAPETTEPETEGPAKAPETTEPATKEPETEAPTETPETTEPDTEAPTDAPDTKEPGSEEPTDAPPVTEVPTETSEPETEAPADTTEPETDAPETTEPVTEAPTTVLEPKAPTDTTEPKTKTPTDVPETETPATTEVMTEAPIDTTEPETEAPTEAPTTTEPETAVPTTALVTTEPKTESPSSFEPAPFVSPTATVAPTSPTPATGDSGNTFEEPAPFDPSTTISPRPTISDATTLFASSPTNLDLTRSSLKELSDSTASMYMQAGETCAAGGWSDSGCFMSTAMSWAMHGSFGSVTLDMSVTNESSALPTTHSLASFAGLGFLAAILIAFAVKRTKARRNGYAAIPSEGKPINSGPI